MMSRRKVEELKSADPGTLKNTPKAWYNHFNYRGVIDYEEGEDRIELPDYRELKAISKFRRKEKPVSKVRHKTNLAHMH